MSDKPTLFRKGELVWWSSWNDKPLSTGRLAQVINPSHPLGVEIHPLTRYPGEPEFRVESVSTIRPANNRLRGFVKSEGGAVALEFAVCVAIGIIALSLVVNQIFIPVIEQVMDLHAHLHAAHHPYDGHTH